MRHLCPVFRCKHMKFQMDERMSSMLSAVIRTENSSIPCAVLNISPGGAKLVIETEDKLPNEFILFLGPKGPVGRRRQVMWHLGSKVGVRFLSVHLDKPPNQESGVWAPP